MVMTLGGAIDVVRRNIKRLKLERTMVCYAASEAVYLLTGKKDGGLTTWRIADGDGQGHAHWFLRGPHGELIDLTAGQFDTLPDYSAAKRRAFYPQVSNTAKELTKVWRGGV